MACFLSLQASRSPAWLHLEDVLVTRWTPVPALSGVRSVCGSPLRMPRLNKQVVYGRTHVVPRRLPSVWLRPEDWCPHTCGVPSLRLGRLAGLGEASRVGRLTASVSPRRVSPHPGHSGSVAVPTRLCIVGLERIACGTPGPPLCTAPSSSSPASRGGSARPTLQPRFPAAPSASPASRALVSKVATGRSRGRA